MNRAPQFLVLESPGSVRMLAFGLRWFALIGSNVPALARSRGRRLRATHYVVGGAPAMVAGYGRAPAGWRRRPPVRGLRGPRAAHLQSAAQLYASLYPDGGHSLLRLPDGRHWLVGAHGGTVLSQTDRVFVSIEEALAVQRALLAQRPGLTEHAGEQVWAALLQAVEPAARLSMLPSRWAELPPALRLFLICVGLAAAAPPLWSTMTGPLFTRAPAKLHPDPGLESQLDAYQAMLRGTATHGPAELPRLLAGVGRLPIHVQGWGLRRAQCDAGAQQWSCSAVYARTHPLATNYGLHALLPDGWHVSFKPLEEATLSWRMFSSERWLADLTLPTTLHVDTRVAGALQRLRPAFAAVILSPPVSLVPRAQVPAATDAMQAVPGQPGFAQPAAVLADMRVVRRRNLTLHGPLRSMALVPGAIPAARWSRLVLDVQIQPRPSLAASTLVAELHGDLYEQE